MDTPRFIVTMDAPGATEPFAIIDTFGRDAEERFYDTAETEEEARQLAEAYNQSSLEGYPHQNWER